MRLTRSRPQAIILSVTRQELLEELSTARAELTQALNGLSREQMLIAGVVGMWSVKDLLAHLVAWESEVVTALNQAQNRRVPSILRIDDIDEWNEKQYRISVKRPFEAVWSDFEGVHRMLYRMLQDVDEPFLTDNRRFPWMEGEALTYLVEENVTWHEQEHADEIRAWRTGLT